MYLYVLIKTFLLQFKFDIHQILALKGYEPIVLCKNGAVDFLSQVKDTHSSGTLNDSDVILQSQAFIIRDKICVISLVQRQVWTAIIIHIN